MKIYFSAVKNAEQIKYLLSLGADSFLFTYDTPKVSFENICYLEKYILDRTLNILVDSGAFSAWNAGTETSLRDYTGFIKSVKMKNKKHNVIFVNLDVIPHKKGTTATIEQINKAAEKGIRNCAQLMEAGIQTMHIFHQFEDFRILDRILKEYNPHNYIGISPANDVSIPARNEWLRKVYYKLQSKTKTHLFGLTAKDSLMTFPAYSADSSSWLNVSKYGELFDFKHLVKINKTQCSRYNALYYDEELTFYNAYKYYIRLQNYLTKLWIHRKITWK